MLAPLLDELSSAHFSNLWRQLAFEVADIHNEIFELYNTELEKDNTEMLQADWNKDFNSKDGGGGTGTINALTQDKKDKVMKSITKVNKAILEGRKHYQRFCDTYDNEAEKRRSFADAASGKSGEEPKAKAAMKDSDKTEGLKMGTDDVRSYCFAKIHAARLAMKYVAIGTVDSKVLERQFLEYACKEYEQLHEFMGTKYKDRIEECDLKAELEVVKEMCVLLPQKLVKQMEQARNAGNMY